MENVTASAVNTTQTTINVVRYARASLCILAVILTSALARPARAGDPPPDLIKLIANRETETEAARERYMYRQTTTVEDLDSRGARLGQYREVREVIFLPDGRRTEEMVEKPSNTLQRLKLTEEDFQDVRNVQPLVVTRDTLFFYESKFRGEENIDGVDCWVVQIRPRQILSGQRFFDGLIWADKKDYSIIRLEGQAVPQIQTTKQENLFPHFTTIREKVDGEYWFPVKTYGEDTLYFRTGPQRMRLIIRYANYKRFSADTKIEYK